MAWITPEAVLGYWVGADAPESDALLKPIKGAETIIRFHFPDMDDRLTADTDGVLMDRLELVVSRMVIRAVKNPDGARSIQTGTGPFQDTVTYGGDDPGSIWMNTDERALLLAVGSETKTGKAFTIDTGAHAAWGYPHLDTCSIWFGGDCSCGAILLSGTLP